MILAGSSLKLEPKHFDSGDIPEPAMGKIFGL